MSEFTDELALREMRRIRGTILDEILLQSATRSTPDFDPNALAVLQVHLRILQLEIINFLNEIDVGKCMPVAAALPESECPDRSRHVEIVISLHIPRRE